MKSLSSDDLERTDAYLSLESHHYRALILCPCGEQLEAESRWWIACHCQGCGARYEFAVNPMGRQLTHGEVRRMRVRVWRQE